jgi:hypothetical protein
VETYDELESSVASQINRYISRYDSISEKATIPELTFATVARDNQKHQTLKKKQEKDMKKYAVKCMTY